MTMLQQVQDKTQVEFEGYLEEARQKAQVQPQGYVTVARYGDVWHWEKRNAKYVGSVHTSTSCWQTYTEAEEAAARIALCSGLVLQLPEDEDSCWAQKRLAEAAEREEWYDAQRRWQY